MRVAAPCLNVCHYLTLFGPACNLRRLLGDRRNTSITQECIGTTAYSSNGLWNRDSPVIDRHFTTWESWRSYCRHSRKGRSVNMQLQLGDTERTISTYHWANQAPIQSSMGSGFQAVSQRLAVSLLVGLGMITIDFWLRVISLARLLEQVKHGGQIHYH